MAQDTKTSLTDRIVNIYTGGGGGGGTGSLVLGLAAVAGIGVGAYFLWKKFFNKGGTEGALWILMETFTAIEATEPTSSAGYWLPMHTLNNLPTTKPTESAAYWVPMQILNNLPVISPTESAGYWLPMHVLNNLPVITPTESAAEWLPMQTLNNLPTTTPAATPGVTNVRIINYPTSLTINTPCSVTVQFTYVGTSGTKALHAAIGQQGAFGFNEMSAVNANVNVPNATSPTNVTATVSIPTAGLSAGVYGLTAKVDAVESGIYQSVVTIIGSTTPVVTGVQITNYPSSLSPGNPCTITVAFNYVGPAATLTARAALGQQGALGFDEKSAVNISVSVPAYTTATPVNFQATIPTTGLASGLYGLTAKVNAVESGVYNNVVSIVGSTTPIITNVRITSYPTGTLLPGSTCPITVAFDYMGPATTAAFHGAIGVKGVTFDEISGCTVDSTIAIAQADTVTTRYFTSTIPVKSSLANGVYDLYCKLGGVLSPYYLDVIVVQAAVTPTLTIADDTITTGDTLNFSFTGFQPNASVGVSVVGGGGINVVANSSGNGSGSFQIGEGAGTYTLRAQDSYGHSATDNFTVSAPSTPTITNVRISNIPSSVVAGQPIPVTILFDYIGSASEKAFHAALGVQGLWSFDEISGCTIDSTIAIPAASTVTTFTFNASIPTKTGLSGYKDLYCKLGGVQSEIYNDKVYIY